MIGFLQGALGAAALMIAGVDAWIFWGAVMVVLGAVTGFAVAVYALADIDECRRADGFFPLLHVLLLGVSCSFVTGDAFNVFVFLEISSLSSYALISQGRTRRALTSAMQ